MADFYLDEVAFYNTALSPARIVAHLAAVGAGYNTSVLADSPQAYYRFGAPPTATVVPNAWAGRPVMAELTGRSGREQTLVNTVSISDTLGEQVSAEFTFVNPTIIPRTGDVVRLLYHRYVLFAGTIDSIERDSNNTQTARYYKARAVDWTQILIRRKARRLFTGTAASAIISSLLDVELAGEGLSIGRIDRSPTLPLAESKDATMLNFMRDIAGVAGQTFYVDFDKRLHMNVGTTITAPALDNTNVESCSIAEDRETYRNRQTIRCIGTPTASGETALEVSIARQSDSLIAERAAIEGGSGIYEETEEITHPAANNEFDLTRLAIGYARLRLATSGQLRQTLKCRVRGYGFRAGMFTTVDLPYIGLSGTWMIQNVRITEEDGRNLVHELELTQGTLQERAYASWLRIVKSGQVVVQMPGALTNTLQTIDTPTVAVGTPYAFIVPAGITSIEFTCTGASGGGGGATDFTATDSIIFPDTFVWEDYHNGGKGGNGGKAIATVDVTPGETLTLTVGSRGGGGTSRAITTYVRGSITGDSGGTGGLTMVQRGTTVICQANGGTGGRGSVSGYPTLGYDGANGTPGSGLGDAVLVGGGQTGGARGFYSGTSGRITLVNGTAGLDGLIEMRY
jgi:hypothetical protein